ncbi:MAG: Smr/MutS family protein [Nitrosospira multiformis]|nr:Smr/MutS family protein [Nitrosospira multiformis]
MRRRERKPGLHATLRAKTVAEGDKREGTVVSIGDNDAALFRDAVRNVVPLSPTDKVILSAGHPPPMPLQFQPARPAVHDALSDDVRPMEPGDEWAFLRPGVSRQTLRRLRRGYWKIEAQLDLHGFTREEARLALAAFMDASGESGKRCLRVIHGKGFGSQNREPVLKTRIGGWLSQREDVLAFCQASPAAGGSGAVLVLLRTPSGSQPATP